MPARSKTFDNEAATLTTVDNHIHVYLLGLITIGITFEPLWQLGCKH